MSLTKNENFEKLIDQIKQYGATASARSTDSQEYKAFITSFPLQSLPTMSLEQYCIGKGDGKSFSWWLERGLESTLGRYSPGTSRGHLLYFMPDGSVYKNRRLAALSDVEALKYTLLIQSTIASAEPKEDIRWLDSDAEIYKRAGVKPMVTVSRGRKLRLVSAYHPEDILPITSSIHIGHFLAALGCPDTDIPAKSKPVARILKLMEYYQEAKNQIPNLSPLRFVNALYDEAVGIAPTDEAEDEVESDVEIPITDASKRSGISFAPLNQILYGPPGTGKTFETVNAALAILDPAFLEANSENREMLKQRFDELNSSGDIRFVTFHQSFSYEDFVEGLRAVTDDNGNLRYEVVDGVFKNLCQSAISRVTKQSDKPVDISGRRIWKMSLGNSLGDDAYIYDECIESGYAMLGWGGSIDFTGCKDRQAIIQRLTDNGRSSSPDDYSVTAINTFMHKVRIGDLVIVSEGNFKFRAIGEVTGDYQFLSRGEQEGYGGARKVNWLRVYAPSRSYDELLNNQFSQMTLYNLKPSVIDMGKLQALLAEAKTGDHAPTKAKVLIIDEINRGNISRIFGELITLIEPSKRLGSAEALNTILPYSKSPFSVPNNVYLIGTMNTADRSLAGLDIALRRRFTFREIGPQPNLIAEFNVPGIPVGRMLATINERIEVLLDRDHCIGHSYFMPLKNDPSLKRLGAVFEQELIPLLKEYFFEDWERIAWVLNDHRKPLANRFLLQPKTNLDQLFGSDVARNLQAKRWELNPAAFSRIDAYLGIIDAPSAVPSQDAAD